MSAGDVTHLVSGKSLTGSVGGRFLLVATFDPQGVVAARIIGVKRRGTWTVSDDGTLCAQWAASRRRAARPTGAGNVS